MIKAGSAKSVLRKARLLHLRLVASYGKGLKVLLDEKSLEPKATEEFRRLTDLVYSDKEREEHNFDYQKLQKCRKWITDAETINILEYISCYDAVTRRTVTYVHTSSDTDKRESFDKHLTRIILMTLAAYQLIEIRTWGQFVEMGIEVHDNENAGRVATPELTHLCFRITGHAELILRQVESRNVIEDGEALARCLPAAKAALKGESDD